MTGRSTALHRKWFDYYSLSLFYIQGCGDQLESAGMYVAFVATGREPWTVLCQKQSTCDCCWDPKLRLKGESIPPLCLGTGTQPSNFVCNLLTFAKDRQTQIRKLLAKLARIIQYSLICLIWYSRDHLRYLKGNTRQSSPSIVEDWFQEPHRAQNSQMLKPLINKMS